MTYDGECFNPVAIHGGFEQWAPVRPELGYVLLRHVEGEGLIHITNVFDDPAYGTSARFRELVEALSSLGFEHQERLHRYTRLRGFRPLIPA